MTQPQRFDTSVLKGLELPRLDWDEVRRRQIRTQVLLERWSAAIDRHERAVERLIERLNG